MYEEVIRLISSKLKGRKIAFRYKDDLFERELKKQLGLEVDLRVSANLELIRKGITSDSEIFNKSNEYLFVICPSCAWNEYDANRYLKAGYIEGRDIIWCSSDHILVPKLNEVVTDNLNNSVECHSEYGLKTRFVFKGKNSHVYVGEGSVLPDRLTIYNNASFEVGNNSRVLTNLIHLSHESRIIIGNDCIIPSGVELLGDPLSVIEIGDSCTMGENTKIRPGLNGMIVLGKDCMLSWDVVLIGHDEHLIYDIETKQCLNNTVGEKKEYIRVDDHVWLGGETVVLGGTHIKKGCMAGYRSLIKGVVPNNSMVVGMPARVVKKNIAWVRENRDFNNQLFDMLDNNYKCFTDEV